PSRATRRTGRSSSCSTSDTSAATRTTRPTQTSTAGSSGSQSSTSSAATSRPPRWSKRSSSRRSTATASACNTDRPVPLACGGRVDIRLRSLTTRATGKLTVEASEGGGRARLTALNLPDPQTVATGATTYVVWAVSGGRIVRLGELKRDERGNGGLAFDRPEGFERYG